MFHFNVDGKQSLNDPLTSVEDLSKATMVELVRNRGMIHTDVGDDGDLFPMTTLIRKMHDDLKHRIGCSVVGPLNSS